VMKAGACDARARLATGFSPALVHLFDASTYAIQRMPVFERNLIYFKAATG